MNFDINAVLADMLSAMKGTVADKWEEVKSVAEQFLENSRERLELIAQMRITGDLTQEKFESRLLDEKLIVEAELNAMEVISKALAQKAANAAMDVVEKAVTTAISAAL